jgi:hypothetical protein
MNYKYSQSQTENESLNSHDVILPHHFVKHVNALVNVLTFARYNTMPIKIQNNHGKVFIET